MKLAPSTGVAVALLLVCASLAAAGGRVTYVSRFQGERIAEEGRIILESEHAVTRVRTERDGTPIPGTPLETGYIDFAKARTYQSAALRDGSRCTVVTPFAELPALEAAAGEDTVLGYVCHHATATVRSNHIDLWFTRDAGLEGSPQFGLVMDGALVLKIVRNGTFEVVAEEVVPSRGEAGVDSHRSLASPAPTASSSVALPTAWGDVVDLATYRARVTSSYVTTVPIFQREVIAFGNEIVNPSEDDTAGVFRYAGGTVIVRRVTLPLMPDDAAVFAEIVQASRGDAYDRTGSIFLIPESRSTSFLDGLRKGAGALPTLHDRAGREYQGVVANKEYEPPVELVRFITPFGVRHYNGQVTVQGLAWEDSTIFKMEVTDLLPLLRGRVWIGAFIGNYDKGGHELSLTLRYHPGSRETTNDPPAGRWIDPVFCTLNLMEMAGQSYARVFEEDTLRVRFEVPSGVRNGRLRYITTGHGGWGAGDEFLPKVNEIRMDGRVIGRFVPWRSDCETYRGLNPASGNFWNGQSSSDFSRSGWCPGAAVSPMSLPLGALAPGAHMLEVAIDMGKPEGTSTSAWNVSGVLLGEFEAAQSDGGEDHR